MSTTKEELGSSFRWLNATQFLGALNDNVFKLLMIFFLVGPHDPEQAGKVSAIALAVFVVPFLLFTAFAGNLADRFSKRNIIVAAKSVEVLAMVVGCAAFMYGSAVAVYSVLFIMATQSAFFGPSKYGIVPELVRPEQLSRANSFLEGLTYLSIVIGTAAAPLLAQITNERYVLAGLVCVAISVAGILFSLRIHRTPPAGTGRKASILFVRDIWHTIWSIRTERELLMTVLAAAYFMLIGAFIQINLIPYGMEVLGFTQVQSGYLFLATAVGIGVGCFWAGRLSGRNVEFGIVPLGALGLAFSSTALALVSGQDEKYFVFGMLFVMGIGAGLFIVPIHAFIQLRSPPKRRGEILAASGFLGWVGVALAAGLLWVFNQLWHISALQNFMVLGAMALVLAAATVIMLPDSLVRLICVLLTRLCYRIKVVGIENVPSDGGVLLVSNHVSWVDSLLVASTQQRRIRYIIERRYYNIWWVKPICKLMRAVPISPDDPPKKIMRALRQARAAMDEGYIVCIFAEGAMTRTGILRQFKRGLERITKGTGYDIVPAYIGGAWGSIFSYYYGKPLSTLPRKFPCPVSIHFGAGLPAGSSAPQIRKKVIELSCDYFNSLKSPSRSLVRHFVKAARKNWRNRCIADSTGKHLSYGRTLTGALALGKEIDKLTGSGDKVGILLPPSAGGALANLAVILSGKVAVNLNYTASEEARNLAIEQCGIECIISARSFLKRVGICEDMEGLVFLEDITNKIKPSAKLGAYLKGLFMPLFVLTKGRYRWGDDPATIIFSSGSTGRPKGVLLSHHNILSNIEALRMVLRLRPNDNLVGVLPFFHSFGFNCALWLPIISGVSVTLIANPLDGETVGKCVRQNRSTILFAPPTFLLNYIRRAGAEDFKTLRLVAAGAEKLRKRLADSFERKFGVPLLEGYGMTELSPVVSLNIPDVEIGGISQVGNKSGSVGHPLPGVAVKIVDVASKEPLEIGAEGLLMIKGPNLMSGYLNMEKETAEVVQNGWYNSGDIAKVDEDGFLTITDRLSRFSKIGGEMIPHVAVEEIYLQSLGTTERVVAVTSVPHPKRGEELVVLHLDKAGSGEKLHEIIAESELPNMWKPKAGNYIKVESIPVLGSGKLDIMSLRKVALAARDTSGG